MNPIPSPSQVPWPSSAVRAVASTLMVVASVAAMVASTAVAPSNATVAPTDAPGGDPVWQWPVAGPRAIERTFIAPATPYAPGHRGIDIRAPGAETALLAPADGVVRFAGIVVDRPVLTIDHGRGVLSSYEPVTALVEGGAFVARGTPVATVLAGHCPVTCVHLGVRVDGRYVSPLLYLGGVPPAVLIPTRDVG